MPFVATEDLLDALGEKSRRKILEILAESPENGLTASDLAERIGKKIPTILHHLQSLEAVGLIENVERPLDSVHRPVKHWRLRFQIINIKIDFANVPSSVRSLAFSFLDHYSKDEGGIITKTLPGTVKIKDIETALSLDREVGRSVRDLLKPETFPSTLIDWVVKDFEDCKEEGIRLQMNQPELEAKFNLDSELTTEIYWTLVETGDFLIDRLSQRISLKTAATLDS